MRAFIRGMGWVTAAGAARGRQARGFAMPVGPLPKLTRQMVFDEPDARFGRLDAFSRLGLVAAALALQDAGLAGPVVRRPFGVVASTVRGCAATDVAYLETLVPAPGAMPSPNLFAYTLPNCFLGEVALRFGLTGPAYVLNEQGPRVAALRLALSALDSGDVQVMLAGVCDVPAPSPWGDAAGVLPGAVFVVLDRRDSADPAPWGEIGVGEGGAVRYGGSVVTGVPGLVEACLAGGPRPPTAVSA